MKYKRCYFNKIQMYLNNSGFYLKDQNLTFHRMYCAKQVIAFNLLKRK